MPGNANYRRLLGFICPGYESEDIDIDWRVVGLLGLPRAGKTTLAFTIANDLEARFGDEFIMLYGYWLHKVMDHAIEDGLLEGKRVAFILIEDATGRVNAFTARKLLAKDAKVFWEIAHRAKEAGLRQFTGWVVLAINFHSYMTLSKYFRNAHALIIKSTLPRWQRYEHEDVSLRWLDATIVRELTRMRYSHNLDDVRAALNKALALTITGWSDVIKYEAVKHPPKNCVDLREDVEEEDEEEGSGKSEVDSLRKEVKALTKALSKLLRETGIRTRVNKGKYVLAKIDGREISLGPIAHLIENRN